MHFLPLSNIELRKKKLSKHFSFYSGNFVTHLSLLYCIQNVFNENF